MQRERFDQLISRRELEIGEVEPGSYRTSTQGVGLPHGARSLVDPGGYHHLRALARAQLAPQAHDSLAGARVEEMQVDRITVVMVPDLVGLHAVEGRKRARGEQEIDGGRGAPCLGGREPR